MRSTIRTVWVLYFLVVLVLLVRPTATAGQPCPATSIPGCIGEATQSLDTTTIVAPSTPVCNVGGQNGWARCYDSATEGLPPASVITGVTFGVQQASADGIPLDVVIFQTACPPTTVGAVELARETIFVNAADSGTFITVPFPNVPVPPSFVVEIERVVDAGGDPFSLLPASNSGGECAPSYLRGADCGVPDWADLASLGFPDVHLIQLIHLDVCLVGDCCSANGSPGCEVPECRDAVCTFDSFCCNVTWDEFCAFEAIDLCPAECQAPPPQGACCFEDATCQVLTAVECEAQGGAYQGDATNCEGMISEVSEPGLEIPDNDPVGVSDTITIPDSFTVSDVDVDLAITHTWVGDLVVTVEHGGTTVVILDRPGAPPGTLGCSNDDIDAVLDDEGPGGPVEDQCRATPPAIGSPPSFTPNEALSAFDGMDAAGDWTITVTDNAGADLGTLDRWSLHITGGPGGVICPFLTDLDAKPGSCPNPLNRKSNGRIPMALVGQDYLDVSTIDLSTLRLQRADGVGGSVQPNEGPPGPHSKLSDVATPFAGELCECHEETADGVWDVMMHFNTQEVVDQLNLWNDFSEGDTVELLLTAYTVDGIPVLAQDCQVIVPPGPGVVNVMSGSPSAQISVDPPDQNSLTGGVTAFACVYPPDPTDVQLSAELARDGYFFKAWQVDGGPLISDPTITVHVETDQERTAEALYTEVSSTRRSCGLGAEVAVLLAPLLWLHGRRRRA